MNKTPLKLRMLRNDILFQFEDDKAVWNDGKLSQVGFKEKTSWGLEIISPTPSAKSPRWARVLEVGPEVNQKDIKIGSRILIEHLMWTNAVEIDRVEYWKTNDEKILAVDEG
jgi:co-chaperonin GroES (HSP10)